MPDVAYCEGCKTPLSEEFCRPGAERLPCPVCGSTARNFNETIKAKTGISVSLTAKVYRAEFYEALALLAKACDDLASKGYERPVLVGGAAVEIHTGGAVVSGDFDFVSAEQQAFGEALVSYGFRREDRPGRLLIGWYHPEFNLGVQVVSGALFDGRSDPLRVEIVEIKDGVPVVVASVEDLIADRLGQYVATEPRPSDRLDQAVKLFQLAANVDTDYLERRIRDETDGELSLADLIR